MGKVERKTNPGVIGDGPDERIPGVTSKDECGLGNGCNGIFHVGDPCSPSRSTTVGMLDKFKEEEQTFLSTSPESSDFEGLPPDVRYLVESLPPSLQEEQQLLADSVLLSPMEAAVIGATGVLAQEEPWAPTRAPNDIVNIENYNNN